MAGWHGEVMQRPFCSAQPASALRGQQHVGPLQEGPAAWCRARWEPLLRGEVSCSQLETASFFSSSSLSFNVDVVTQTLIFLIIIIFLVSISGFTMTFFQVETTCQPGPGFGLVSSFLYAQLSILIGGH